MVIADDEVDMEGFEGKMVEEVTFLILRGLVGRVGSRLD